MKCPYCAYNENQVLDSRDSEDLFSVRRRRECLNCGKRFTTYERIEAIDLFVIKKDGRREQFDRNKLLTGIKKACEKRPISMDTIEETVEEIEQNLRKRETTEIPSKVIGEIVMRRLRAVDKVAYIRFASVYRAFEDVVSFEKEVKSLLKSEKTISSA
ncbi:MAG: transcriptional regulator NrdR [Candidatus Woykebacteria bacterium GWB1_45_5]|uniref:Transcriptional repressor NrdR n=2 Tax=Candidatus Woykeibacteriota TaxID=1817899 RepID=A0A1G1W4U2_9BACT|nr:MAG: transcriptional regulator NrdR [Candidatus Woykebacteria bacterium GWA1_44_8]OGY23616.1 MAG: transcriptional regulator NrdR [Candidatus Woykebacteria bacterium GWB1_45_5]